MSENFLKDMISDPEVRWATDGKIEITKKFLNTYFGTKEFFCIQFNESITSKEAMDKIEELGLRSATLEEAKAILEAQNRPKVEDWPHSNHFVFLTPQK